MRRGIAENLGGPAWGCRGIVGGLNKTVPVAFFSEIHMRLKGCWSEIYIDAIDSNSCGMTHLLCKRGYPNGDLGRGQCSERPLCEIWRRGKVLFTSGKLTVVNRSFHESGVLCPTWS